MINYIEKGAFMHQWLANHGVTLIQKNGIWMSNSPDETVNKLISEYNPWPMEKKVMLESIDLEFENAISEITAGWPSHEMQTWPKQESEARAYLEDPQSSTPMLLVIAETRGITVEDLAKRVVRDADVFTRASANFLGLRHNARKKISELPNEGHLDRLPELWAIKLKD